MKLREEGGQKAKKRIEESVCVCCLLACLSIVMRSNFALSL